MSIDPTYPTETSVTASEASKPSKDQLHHIARLVLNGNITTTADGLSYAERFPDTVDHMLQVTSGLSGPAHDASDLVAYPKPADRPKLIDITHKNQ